VVFGGEEFEAVRTQVDGTMEWFKKILRGDWRVEDDLLC
jgi:hypothetical protein